MAVDLCVSNMYDLSSLIKCFGMGDIIMTAAATASELTTIEKCRMLIRDWLTKKLTKNTVHSTQATTKICVRPEV